MTHLRPLVSASRIRESMVKIMVTSDSREQPTVGDGCGEGSRLDAIMGRGEFHNATTEENVLMDPSTCVFWCAVALGALVRGSPVEMVSTAVVGSPATFFYVKATATCCGAPLAFHVPVMLVGLEVV